MINMEEEIIKVLEKIRPYLQNDGGDLEFVSFDEENGIVYIRMIGACVDCIGIDQTLKLGIEVLLIDEVPGVNGVALAT